MDNESETLVVPAEEELERYFTLKFGKQQVKLGFIIPSIAVEIDEAEDDCWRKDCNGTQSAGLLQKEGKEFTIHVPVKQGNLKQTYLFWKMKCDKCGSIRAHRRDWIRWIWENGEPFVLCDDGDSLHWTAR